MLSADEMADRFQALDAVADDLADRQHRGCQDGAWDPPHPIPEDHPKDDQDRIDREAAGRNAAHNGSIVTSPATRKITTPAVGPRIGTKFSRKAIVPQSSGLPSPHSHITIPVTTPTATFIIVIVARKTEMSPSICCEISTACRFSLKPGRTSTRRRRNRSPDTRTKNSTSIVVKTPSTTGLI